MHSIYKGTITHTRHLPKRHHFKYSITMLFIDLDHLINAFNKNLFWSYNRLNIGSLNKLDYYVNNKKEIKRIIKKYKPNKIFYFAGQSSLTKSYKYKKETRLDY